MSGAAHAAPRPRRAAGAGDGPNLAENGADSGDSSPPIYARILVAFGGGAGVPWLRWLRPGFRHCFAAVDDGRRWLTVDPLLHRLEVRDSGLASSFDLAGEYRRMGLAVVEVEPGPVPLRRAPLGLFTCVETVKRLLGLRARWVLTPWQLYRSLTNAARRESAADTPSRRRSRLRTKEENTLDSRRVPL